MGFFRRLFGSGVVRVEGETTQGKKFSAKVPFEGTFDSEQDLIQELARAILIEKNTNSKRLRVVAIDCRGSDTEITGNWFSVNYENAS